MIIKRTVHLISAVLLLGVTASAVEEGFVNSVGMEMLAIPAGSFRRGSADGNFDEKPIHNVTINRPFYMSTCEVTNAQYEQFDPDHGLIDHRGFSHEPNEAVIFVSWHDANRFCQWLSREDGRTYRLPTEAEWEYACRAGTTTAYNTGDDLPEQYHKNQRETTGPDPVGLDIGRTGPNLWGLCDMHGNVEEWCHDWYGPYVLDDQTDPVGYVDGDFRVTRGGSHSTPVRYLRSANRMGTLPKDKHWLVGFRVVSADLPTTEPLAEPPPERHQTDVSQQTPPDIGQGPDPSIPHFNGPRKYVNIPPGSNGPLYSRHNHDPAIIDCPNGDLLAIWYSTLREKDRELSVAASRLRYRTDQWEQASLFWDAPDRNDHCPAMWVDETGKIYHFAGLADAATWGALAVVMRTSTDNGATWSRARLIVPTHANRHMPVESVFRTSGGAIVLPCDANPGTAIWLSDDDAQTWYDPGGTIAGIHAGVVELTDGRLIAFGRGDNIDGSMPTSISSDMGRNWEYFPSEFPPVSGGQRVVLRRLREGPILFVSFTSQSSGMVINAKHVYGMFAALSFNDGQTWPIKKLVTAGGPGRELDGGGNTGKFVMDDTHAEPRGYLAATQTPDGVIHLISSALHYEFNLEWLAEHSRIIDDFELYSETDDLLKVWSDGRTNQTNMVIELDTEDREGSYSMRCTYDTNSPPHYAEADAGFDPPRDWTSNNIKALELWFRGRGVDPNTSDHRMYVAVEDASGNAGTIEHDDFDALVAEQWTNWNIDLHQLRDSGVDLTKISKFTLSLSGTGRPGTVYFDDIKLFPPRCLEQLDSPGDFNKDCVVDAADLNVVAADWLDSDRTFEARQPNPNGLLLWYKFDETEANIVTDYSGNERHGLIRGATDWDPNGYHDGCLSFNDDTAVDVPTDTLGAIEKQITITVWLNGGERTLGRDNTIFETGADGIYLRADVPDRSGRGVYWRAGIDPNDVLLWTDVERSDWLDFWNHYAFVKDAGEGIMRVYCNGALVAEKTDAFTSLAPVRNTTFDIGAIISHSNDYIGKMDDFKIYNYALKAQEIAGAATGGGSLYIPVKSPANLYDDATIDLKDFADFARHWLRTGIWP